MAGRAYTTYPYRVEYPDCDRDGRSCKTLEDALWEAHSVHSRWYEDNEYGRANEYVHPESDRAVVTNRNTGYRWIVLRDASRIEFQTPEIFEDIVGDETIDVRLTVEEAEALARMAAAGHVEDKRTRALAHQALDQMAHLCRVIRERVASADDFFGWARQLHLERLEDTSDEESAAPGADDAAAEPERPKVEPRVVSLKRAARILGKAPSTLYKWYREGNFPPAVDVSKLSRYPVRVPVVVPLDRLEAWLAGEPMRPMLEQVFESVGLREPPWACLRAREGSSRADIEYWIAERGLTKGFDGDGRRIYGWDLDASKRYELSEK